MKVTPEVFKIVKSLNGKMKQVEISKVYNLSNATIWKINQCSSYEEYRSDVTAAVNKLKTREGRRVGKTAIKKTETIPSNRRTMTIDEFQKIKSLQEAGIPVSVVGTYTGWSQATLNVVFKASTLTEYRHIVNEYSKKAKANKRQTIQPTIQETLTEVPHSEAHQSEVPPALSETLNDLMVIVKNMVESHETLNANIEKAIDAMERRRVWSLR